MWLRGARWQVEAVRLLQLLPPAALCRWAAGDHPAAGRACRVSYRALLATLARPEPADLPDRQCQLAAAASTVTLLAALAAPSSYSLSTSASLPPAAPGRLAGWLSTAAPHWTGLATGLAAGCSQLALAAEKY